MTRVCSQCANDAEPGSRLCETCEAVEELERDIRRANATIERITRERDAAMAEVERMRADMLARQVHLDNGRTIKCGVCGEVATGVCMHMIEWEPDKP